jgi:mRNA interferase MazF
VRRGDLVLVRGGGGPAAKPRPCLVVQRSSTIDGAPKITICPLTSTIRVSSDSRPVLQPSDSNGLTKISQVQIDWIFTYAVDRIEKRIGTLDDIDMHSVDLALRRWLDL